MDGSRDYSHCMLIDSPIKVKTIGNAVQINETKIKFWSEIFATASHLAPLWLIPLLFDQFFGVSPRKGKMLMQPIHTITLEACRNIKSKGITTVERLPGHAHANWHTRSLTRTEYGETLFILHDSMTLSQRTILIFTLMFLVYVPI